MPIPDKQQQFEQIVLPHLSAAYNLAHWLTGHNQDAEDVVQESYLRAFKFFDGFRGGDSRAWLLAIVRNTTYTWLRQNRAEVLLDDPDNEQADKAGTSTDPEDVIVQNSDRQTLTDALNSLPLAFREVVILHDVEGMSYKEIARVVHVPIGTVMSRLSRARSRLRACLSEQSNINTVPSAQRNQP